MSAVPKKKLCWNCEGNIVADIDNCPYCGVYVHPPELDEVNHWSSSYAAEEEEEIPSPVYQLHPEKEQTSDVDFNEESNSTLSLSKQIKQDLLPILLLMSGSVFFLFGIVLLLFSQDGTLILQWNGNSWPYILTFSLLSVGYGWRLLAQANPEEKEME